MGKMFRLLIFVGGVFGVGFLVFGGMTRLMESEYVAELMLFGMTMLGIGLIAGLVVGATWSAFLVRLVVKAFSDGIVAASGSERAIANMMGSVAGMMGHKPPGIVVSAPPAAPAWPGLRQFQLTGGQAQDWGDDTDV